ncbi:MAG: prolipoprotein diacylglyceryl transferase family protein [Candidatus Ventricola sp.]
MKKTGIAAVLCVLLLLVLCFAVPDGQILWEAGDALYTGEALPALTGRVLPYGAGLAASAVLAWAVAFALAGKRTSLRGAICWFAWALALGILLSRLLYCVVETAYYNPKWFSRLAALRLWDGGMAMTGALAGVLLAVKLVPEGAALVPAAVPLFVAGARLSEVFTQVGYGPSVYFEGPLSRQVGYAVRLNVSLLEAAAALVIFVCVLLLPRWAARRKLEMSDGKRLCAFLIFYGVSQIFMESLRKDRHMIWGFTKAQQIMAILLVFGALMVLAKGGKEKRHALVITLCAAAPLVVLEFALDRADVSIWLLYGAYLLILAAYLWGACRMLCRSMAPEGAEGAQSK